MKVGDRVRVIKRIEWDDPVSKPGVWTNDVWIKYEYETGKYIGRTGIITNVAEFEHPENNVLIEFENHYGGASFWVSELEVILDN